MPGSLPALSRRLELGTSLSVPFGHGRFVRHPMLFSRRRFLGAAAAAASTPGMLTRSWAAPSESIPIIDTHIHLFDPTRPQGVPWPEPTNKILYQPALPA